MKTPIVTEESPNPLVDILKHLAATGYVRWWNLPEEEMPLVELDAGDVIRAHGMGIRLL
jgi:hypothetical protein